MDFLQLADKSILIFGVANRKSVAWHVGRVLDRGGCDVRLRRAERRGQAERRPSCSATPRSTSATSSTKTQIARLRDEIGRRGTRRFHGLVHSIAFADYADGMKPFHETPKTGLPAGGRHLVLLADRHLPTP